MTICCFRFLAHVFLCSSIILHLYTRPAVLFFSLVHFQLLYFIILWLMYVFYYTLMYFHLSFLRFSVVYLLAPTATLYGLRTCLFELWYQHSVNCFVCFVAELFYSCLNLVVIQLCHSYIILVINDVTLTTTKFEGVLCVTLHGPFSVLQCSLITFFISGY